ncbi:hypothetical protein CVIRNUC_004061 [Coccomyxa viridis]|uniref:DNA polymerase delta subunit 3 n=1 Tax=Coccomyxa viridis TaxID=1274662 RepID=A0AAV1I0F7_9CHLO|nr:hypothetical protein CVIRNUC_004061 [Coccomyxa viridis]
MSAASKQKVFEELRDLISDQLKAVTFKWLARHLSMPANDAKRLLFEFSEKHRSKVSSTYLIAGWTKGAVPQHSVQLIDASDVADKRSKLDPVTSLHVYSIRPSAPKGPSDIFNYDELQTKELFLGMVKRGEENCLSDNRWSAVQCQGAKRNPSMAQASKSAMPVASSEEKPASAVAAAIKDAAEGKMPLQAAAADKTAGREPDAEQDSASAKATEQPTAKPAAAKGKGSAIASMWSKAPPKKAGKAAPKQTPASAKSKAAAVDAEAFLRLNQQDAASSSGEEEENNDAPIRRTQRPARADALADSDDDGGNAPSAKPSAPAAEAVPANKQQRKRKTVLDEDSDSDEDWDAPKKASDADAAVRVTTSEPVKAEAITTANAEAAEAEEEPAPEKKPKKSRKTSASTKRSAPGTVKLHNSTTGPVRKRVQRTAYNEKGEEVTEMVSEDEEPEKSAAKADKQGTEPAAEEKPKQVAQPPAAATSRSESNGGVKRKAGTGVDSKPAKKPASKSKASMSAGQRNIKSFFVKK